MNTQTPFFQKFQAATAIFLVLFLVVAPLKVQAQEEAPAMTITVREGNDYATRVLGDPWDMNAFTDIEQGLNFEGRYDNVRNYHVNNGIFSYTSGTNPGSQATFYPLWPGYGYEMLLGKVGALYPIDTSKYKCLYTRAKITYTTTPNDDFFLAWWHKIGNDPTPGRALKWLHTPDSAFLNNKYRMYQLNLVNDLDAAYNVPWQSRATWPALKIQPTVVSGQTSGFEIDWVRLTDCQPVNAEFTWGAVSQQVRMWASKGGQQKDIFISAIDPGQTSFTWDVQGFEPGTYQIGIENVSESMTWLNTYIKIVAAPTVRFTSPAGILGEDYATSFGNAWDMVDGSDFMHNNCATVSWENGDAVVVTNYPAALPAHCKGGIGEADVQMVLNRPPGEFDAAAYRYLSFRMYINGTQPLVPDGMIGRLIWIARQGNGYCFQVSDGIPYRIGWNTYTIDLWNPLYGTPEATSPYTTSSCSKMKWIDSHSVIQVRFDPNENYTGVLFPNTVPPMAFVQKFAWMRLTKTEQVTIGDILKIGFNLNKDMPNSQVDFFYTNNLSDPTQNPVSTPILSTQDTLAVNPIFLPLIYNYLPEYIEGSQNIPWDTSGATPGEYYICAVANDGYNQTTFCSDAPVKLTH